MLTANESLLQHVYQFFNVQMYSCLSVHFTPTKNISHILKHLQLLEKSRNELICMMLRTHCSGTAAQSFSYKQCSGGNEIFKSCYHLNKHLHTHKLQWTGCRWTKMSEKQELAYLDPTMWYRQKGEEEGLSTTTHTWFWYTMPREKATKK